MLKVDDIHAAYGRSAVLFGVSFEIRSGEVVSLLGRNGMGKTTTLRSLMGIVRLSQGNIQFQGTSITGLKPYGVARAGLGYVPEGRLIFPNLTVQENLEVAARGADANGRGWGVGEIFELFPRLKERRSNMGEQLSGGEQQMVAIGRALMTNPKLLILDEATEGLAPLIREEVWEVVRYLKSLGQSILIVDKNIKTLMVLASRHLIMEKGKIVWSGSSQELNENPELQIKYLGV